MAIQSRSRSEQPFDGAGVKLSLEKTRRVTEILKEVPVIPFGKMDEVAQTLAHEIFLFLVRVGLHSEIGKGVFTTGGQYGEDFEISGPGYQLIQGYLQLCKELSSTRLAPKGTVLLNTMSIYLGIAIVTDPDLKAYEKRKKLLLETLQLCKLPIGLYSIETGKQAPEQTIQLAVLFDMQERDASILPFFSKTRIDIIAYNGLQKKLKKVILAHTSDLVITDWCQLKLKELEIFARVLLRERQLFILNRWQLQRWQK